MLNLSHIINEQTQDMCLVCCPLKYLNVDTFIYIKNYKNGKIMHLSNKGDWLKYFHKNELYKHSPFERTDINYNNCLMLWSAIEKQMVFEKAKKYFNIADGITLVEKDRNGVEEFYLFGTTVDRRNEINFYINNIDLFKKFILYFKSQAIKLITKAEKNLICLPNFKPVNPSIIYGLTLEDYISNKNIQSFTKEIEIKKYFIGTYNLSSIYLTKRELDVTTYLLHGKSASVIGNRLNMSKRTVETHIENMKNKLGCFSKKQLVLLLKSSDIGKYM